MSQGHKEFTWAEIHLRLFDLSETAVNQDIGKFMLNLDLMTKIGGELEKSHIAESLHIIDNEKLNLQ